jgi:hypothetical protein
VADQLANEDATAISDFNSAFRRYG